MRITTKLIGLFLLIALLPITLISFFSYITAKEAITSQVVKQLGFVAALEKGRINALIDQNLERLSTVTRQMEASPSALLQGLSAATPSAMLNQKLQEAKDTNGSFKDILLLDQSGQVIASTDKSIINENEDKQEFFVKGKQRNVIANFFLDNKNEVRVYLAGPLHAENSVVGVVVAVESDVDTIRALIRDYEGLGQTGELQLAKWEGDNDAVFIAPSRFHANAALRRRVSAKDIEDPMIKALSRQDTVVKDSIDYRGKHVLAVTRYIDRADWGLVVKMDRDEAFSSIQQLGSYFFYAALMTGILAILNAWYFAQSITRPMLLLSSAADAIRKGDLSGTIDIHSHDEIGQLAETFRDMTQKLKESYGILEQKVADKTAQLAGKVKEREQELAKDRALLASIGDGVIVTDEQERIILANVSAQELLKCPESDLLGKVFTDAIHVDVKKGIVVNQHKSPITAALLLRRKITTSVIGDINFIRKDGSKFPVGLTVTPVILEGIVIGTILIFRDMTIAGEIDRMKTEFISLASHQLRTPLSAIRWFSDMLLEGDVGEINGEQKEVVENISAANARMIDLVNSLLNISRLESGKIANDPKPTNLGQIVQEVVADLKVKIDAKRLRVVTDIPVNLPMIIIDPKLMREVYMNLLTNAIKYTPDKGMITLSCVQKGNTVTSSVQDTGYGIPKKEQDRVFGKFYRGGNIISKETEGTGLGLYLVKEIITSSGGAIWFESEEGKGTTFWISLPIHPLPAGENQSLPADK